MTVSRIILAVLAAMLLALGASAGNHEAGHASDPADSPAAAAYAKASARMHDDMPAVFTGDADVDFALAMIPHHQGAIDMARVALQYGQDPDIRTMAEAVIATQDAEIAFLQSWLAARGY